MSSELDDSFVSLASGFLSQHPELLYEWREVKDLVWGPRIDLICRPGSSDEVYASLLGGQIAVGASGGDHLDFTDYGRGLTSIEVARQALARLVELLAESGRRPAP